MKSTKGGTIVKFIIEFIISRYGVPSKLFMGNGPSFKGNEVKEFFAKYYIERKFSTTYFPQGNGQAEASNKFIKSILYKTVAKHGKD